MIYMTFIYQTVSQCIAAIQIEQQSPFNFYWYNQSTKSDRLVHIYIFFNLYPNKNLEFRQFAKHNITINK